LLIGAEDKQSHILRTSHPHKLTGRWDKIYGWNCPLFPSESSHWSSEVPGSQRSLTRMGSRQEWKDKTTHISRGPGGYEKTSFSQQALYKRGRDLNIKTLWPSYNPSVFAILYIYSQCSWLSISFFSVKGNHLALLPTMRDMVHLKIPTLSECC
jgi:hypothetical protein